MIKGFKEGHDLTLMNTIYGYPTKDFDSGKWDKGSMAMVVKDNDTGLKHVVEIENPPYEYYYAKESTLIEHSLFFIEKEKVDKVTVPYNELMKDIAERTDNVNFYFDNIKNGNRRANSALHTHPRVFMSDANVEDNTRFRFSNAYKNTIGSVSKAFFDIEARIFHMKGDFPEMGECPIDAVTLINKENNMVYTLLLRDKENPLVDEFEAEAQNSKLFQEVKDFVIDAVGGSKRAKLFGIDKLNFQFQFYDEADEINLIKDLFNLINILEPDFILAWNMAFDIPYIIQRILNLGYDPKDIMCHPDFKMKHAKYNVDDSEDRRKVFAERGDWADISSKTIYLDQLLQFASRRKGQSSFASFKLDDIGAAIAGVRKYDWHHITTKFKEIARKNFKLYTFYNIMDVIVQVCIEDKVEDVDYVFGKAVSNNTRYSKVHRQTVYLTNRAIQEFYNEGFVMGNNCNRLNVKPPKFKGAFVADPNKASDYAKVKINGVPINIFDNLDDFDYERLYPSMLQEFNMAPNTQIGKLEISEKVNPNENRFKDTGFDRGGSFLEDLQSRVYLEFCTRWFNMASYGELYDDVTEYYTTVMNPAQPLRYFAPNGNKIVITKLNNGMMKPITKNAELMYNPIDKFYVLTNDIKESVVNAINRK